MLRIHLPQPSLRRLILLLPCLLGGAAFAIAGAAEPQTAAAYAGHGDTLPAAYRIVNLGSGDLIALPKINDRGQVTIPLNNRRALFYDGTRIVDLGTLGGSFAIAGGLNNVGQVVGASYLPGDPPGTPEVDPYQHPFVWSRNTGMIDLGTPGGSNRSGAGWINDRGQVAGGYTVLNTAGRSFRWTPGYGFEYIGVLPGSTGDPYAYAIPYDMNENGLVTGVASNADRDQRGFVWTRKTGIIELATFGGSFSNAGLANARDQVVGAASLPDNHGHAFIWDVRNGQQDLGVTGAATDSFPMAINDRSEVVGGLTYSLEQQRGFYWTRATGLFDIGTLGGIQATPFDINDKGQAVGRSTIRSEVAHAFLWTRKGGMVDLNKRLRHAPAGLVLDTALLISNNGSIVATSNAGLILLKPDCGCPAPHAVGPIDTADMVEVGMPFDGKVGFAGSDTNARHYVNWSWGDGSASQPGQASERQGSGTGVGTHTYAAPGIYTISATVTDLRGNSSTVTRQVVAYDKTRGVVRGSGAFLSPQGPGPVLRADPGPAAFRLLAAMPSAGTAAAAKGELQFSIGTSTFRSKSLKAVAQQGGSTRFEGSATKNGGGDYRFTLTTTAGDNRSARFGLKIWHADPVTRTEVVDYDNLRAGPGNSGSVVAGSIVHQL